MVVLADVHELTPERLTSLLRATGVLTKGVVESITPQVNDAFNSVVWHLEVTYSSDASALTPRALLLKLSRNHDGLLEHLFYHSQLELHPSPLPIVHCYDTAYSPSSGQSHCLLQDLSSTHRPPITRQQLLTLEGVPSDWHLNQIVETLAQFHAYWWQHPQLGKGDGFFANRPLYRDQAHYERHIARRQAEWAKFITLAGEQLPFEKRALYEKVLVGLPQLWERYLAPRLKMAQHLTITQGDCYLTQFLCPKTDETATTYLVDFDSVSANFGAYDLAYLLPTFWTRQQRYEHNREQQALRRYYQVLIAHGVTDYSWETLLADYQLMVTFMIFDPVWDQTNGSAKTYWWPKLQCLTDAYLDLNCAALLTA